MFVTRAQHSKRRHLTRLGRVALSSTSAIALLSGYMVLLKTGPSPSASAAAAGDPVVAAVGDIACAPGRSAGATHCQQAATGNLLTTIKPSLVIPLGDSQYVDGTPAEYAGSYDLTKWGTNGGSGGYRSISRPAAGNHEYHTTGATGYFGYFGGNAGDAAKGYYSYDVTGPNNAFRWHMVVLNSECANVGGCGVGSVQEKWLKADLAANANACTMAYWHRPRFSSSSTTPSSTTYAPFFNDLYNAGADVVLNGHAHNYERFAPQTSTGAPDPSHGVTEFVVGTGGDDFQNMGPAVANSVVSNNTSFGVVKMTLHATSYDWQFLPASGYSFTDAGSANCHGSPGADTTPPSQPTTLAASAPAPNQVNLSWTASTDDVAVTGYRIYRGANGATPTLLASTTTSATTYTDTAAVASTPYEYQVQAVDAASNVSPMSTKASVTTPASSDTGPPSAPTNLAGEEIGPTEIDLNWTPSTDAGTGISGYRVYRGVSGSGSLGLIATTVGTQASYADLTTTGNTRYDYQVVAVDGAGNASGPSNIFTQATPPGATTQTYSFTAAGDATVDLANTNTNYGSDTKLAVDGSPATDALLKFNVSIADCQTVSSATLGLTDNANASPSGGDVYTTGSQWTESTVTWNNAPGRGVLLNSLGEVVSQGHYVVDVTKGLSTTNGEVDFRMGSTNSDGAFYYPREAGTGTNRPVLSVTCSKADPDSLAPTAPSSLTGNAANNGEVDLAWQTATDNVAVTDYRIYRNGTMIGSIPGDALSYRDTTVAPRTTYSYSVAAVDAAGNVSPMSNTVSATTPK